MTSASQFPTTFIEDCDEDDENEENIDSLVPTQAKLSGNAKKGQLPLAATELEYILMKG